MLGRYKRSTFIRPEKSRYLKISDAAFLARTVEPHIERIVSIDMSKIIK